ncbi:hypothetical protein [Ornithinimicrobium sufpigmenti]|uniref:hypothetical protein n=1 Tax=Ornithinimicrobium sufpigmenti TaxID=2508882 RepID=UPI0010364278|nr:MULTISPECIES: hypothetical protein [unclassified Ornithinimicrobium]
MYNIDDPSQVDIVQEITLDQDGMRQRQQCLADRGWPVTLEEGGMSIDVIPVEQQQALNLDQYICEAAYPVAAKYQSITLEEQQRRWYHYLVSTYVPCVEALGYAVTEPPTLERFLATQTTAWRPAAEVADQTRDDGTAFHTIDEQCPQSMPVEMLEP